MKHLLIIVFTCISLNLLATEPVAPMCHISSIGIVKGVVGYNGEIPVSLYIHSDTIVSTVLEKNRETRAFLQVVIDGGLLTSWNGHTLQEAATMEVDAITAATRSSKAIIETVQSLATYVLEKESEKNKNFWEIHWQNRCIFVPL